MNTLLKILKLFTEKAEGSLAYKIGSIEQTDKDYIDSVKEKERLNEYLKQERENGNHT